MSSGPQCTPSDHRPVEQQQDHRAEKRHQESRILLRTVHASCAADETTEQCACDTDQHRHDDAAGVAAGHHELGERAHDQTKHNPSNYVHNFSSCATYGPGVTGGGGSSSGTGAGSSRGWSGVGSSPSRSRRSPSSGSSAVQAWGSGGVRLWSDVLCTFTLYAISLPDGCNLLRQQRRANVKRRLFLLALGSLMAATAAYAHHSFARDYHEAQMMSLEGDIVS